jgi:hypothetical protein
MGLQAKLSVDGLVDQAFDEGWINIPVLHTDYRREREVVQTARFRYRDGAAGSIGGRRCLRVFVGVPGRFQTDDFRLGYADGGRVDRYLDHEVVPPCEKIAYGFRIKVHKFLLSARILAHRCLYFVAEQRFPSACLSLYIALKKSSALPAVLNFPALRACLESFKSYFKLVTFSYTKMKIFLTAKNAEDAKKEGSAAFSLCVLCVLCGFFF